MVLEVGQIVLVVMVDLVVLEGVVLALLEDQVEQVFLDKVSLVE